VVLNNNIEATKSRRSLNYENTVYFKLVQSLKEQTIYIYIYIYIYI